jgi:hypothetical protein
MKRISHPDGDKIRILQSDGKPLYQTCRYIDEYIWRWAKSYHICGLPRLEQNGNTIIPLRTSLPKTCYGILQIPVKLSSSRKRSRLLQNRY